MYVLWTREFESLRCRICCPRERAANFFAPAACEPDCGLLVLATRLKVTAETVQHRLRVLREHAGLAWARRRTGVGMLRLLDRFCSACARVQTERAWRMRSAAHDGLDKAGHGMESRRGRSARASFILGTARSLSASLRLQRRLSEDCRTAFMPDVSRPLASRPARSTATASARRDDWVSRVSEQAC